MIEMLWLAAGGFLGAIARYGIQLFFSTLWPTIIPIGTLVVNLVGSFLLGWIVGSGIDAQVALFLGTGFMGAFTTFSTLKLESIHLFQNGEGRMGLIYLGLTYGLGMGAAMLGFYIAMS